MEGETATTPRKEQRMDVRFTKALRISPLCNSICVLKSIFEGSPARVSERGGARISFSRRNIVRVPGGALERRYNVVSPPPQVSLFAGNGIRREEGAAIEREIPKATQCYQEIFLRLALCRRRGIGEEDRERRYSWNDLILITSSVLTFRLR